MNSVMETVSSVCTHVRNQSKHGVSFQNLLTLLRRQFRENGFQIKIRSDRNKQLDSEEFYVNAYYDAEDDKNQEIAIEVVIHHNFVKTLIWDRKHISDLLVQIFDATVHEFKHQRQSIKRKYKVYSEYVKQPYKDYLAEDDEIDAYALSIAIELCRSIGKYRALRYLSKISNLSRLKFREHFVSPNLSAYFGQFDNLDNPVLRRLTKKIYIRLQKIDTDVIFV